MDGDKPKKSLILSEIVSSAVRTTFLTFILLLATLILSQSNLLGYFNFGTSFNAFPNEYKNVAFSDVFGFLKEVPFNKVNQLEKWATPIKIRYEGKYNQKDIEVLNEIAKSFNTIKGFPGIKIVDQGENVLVSYITLNEFSQYKEKYKADADKQSFCMHNTNNGIIYKGNIVIINDGFQGYKNSTVLHEFFHLIGFFDHTTMSESILNKVGPVPSLSTVDVLAFKMIYNPNIKAKATYSDIEKYYSKADVNTYISYSNKSTKNSTNIFIIIAIVAFFLMIDFLSSIKKFGILLSIFKVIISVLVCGTILYFYKDIEILFHKFIQK